MADYEFDYRQIPPYWPEAEKEIFEHLTMDHHAARNDPQLQDIYDTAMFQAHGLTHEQHDLLESLLRNYLDEVWDIDFDDMFDWEAWREWYDSV